MGVPNIVVCKGSTSSKKNLVTTLYLIVILLFLIMLPTSSVNALSGKWNKSFKKPMPVGTSEYTLILESPDEVSSNADWNIQTSLTVEHMDGQKVYLWYSAIMVTIETENGELLKKTAKYGHYPLDESPSRLFPGGQWGPETITFHLAEEHLNIPAGGTVEATIYLTIDIAEYLQVMPEHEHEHEHNDTQLSQPSGEFETYSLTPRSDADGTIYCSDPYGATYETFSLTVGTVKIVGEGNILANYFPYIVGSAVGIAVFTGILVRKHFINS